MPRRCTATRAPSGSPGSRSPRTRSPGTGSTTATTSTARSRASAVPTDERPGSLHRFSRGERVVHWTVAGLMGTCIGTAAVLYNGSLALLVGHRHVVEVVHVYAGYGLPV